MAGITPAWAGKSSCTTPSVPTPWDHPRVGGEKAFLFSRGAPPWGSPPRGRGKDAVLVAALLHDRITPAWAGKRRCTARREPASRDHPRVGGEKLPSIISCIVQPGSPPRGRGKGLFSTIPGGCPGITPAWAGKRLKRSHRSGIFISGPIPFHSVLHRPAGSGGSRAGRDGSPAGQPQNTGPA